MLKKIISTLLLVTFVGQTLYADMPAKPALAPTVHSLSQLTLNPHLIRISTETAQVRETHVGTNGRLIVHIQDAHSNYGAQKNMSKLIGELAHQYGMKLVLVEGSSGDVTLDWIKKIAPENSIRILANQFLERGFISGEEYLNLTSDIPLRLWGLEDRALYDKGLGIYARLVKRREKILSFLGSAQSAVDALKSRLYPKEVIEYESIAESGFKHSFENLLELSKKHQLDPHSFEQIRKMSDVLESEKNIDFNAPQDAAYAGYLSQAAAIDMFRFLDEQESLESQAYNRALSEEDARIVRALDRYIGLLKKAYSTRIGSDEFETLRLNRPDFPERSWIAFLNHQLVEAGLYDRLIPENSDSEAAYGLIEDFYRTVNERDGHFMIRTQAALESGKDQAAFVIAGGYHTDHLKELWRREGYSYVVLSPVVSDSTDSDRYEKLLFAALGAKPDTYRKPGLGEPGGPAVFLNKDGKLPATLPGMTKRQTGSVYRGLVLRQVVKAVRGSRAKTLSPEQQAEVEAIIARAETSGDEIHAYRALLAQFISLVTDGRMNADEIAALHGFAQRVSADDFLHLLEILGYRSEAGPETPSKTYVIDSSAEGGWLPQEYRDWLADKGPAPQFAVKVRADIWRENPAYTLVSDPANEEDAPSKEEIYARFDIDTPYIYVIPNVNSRRRMMGLAVYAIDDPDPTASLEFQATGIDMRLSVAQVLRLSRESHRSMKRLFFVVQSGRVLPKPIVPSEISILASLDGSTAEGRSIPQLIGRVFDSTGSLVLRLLHGEDVHYQPRLVVDPLLAKANGHWVIPAVALGEHNDDTGDIRLVDFSTGRDMPRVSESIIKYSQSRAVYPAYFDGNTALRIIVLTPQDNLDKVLASFDARHNPFGYERGKDYEIVSIDDYLGPLKKTRDRLALADPKDPIIGIIDRLNSILVRLRDRRIGRDELETLETELNGIFLKLGVKRMVETDGPDAPAKYEIVDHAWIGPDEVTRNYLKESAQESPLDLDTWISASFERLINSDGPDGQWKAYYTTDQLVFMRENVKSIVELSRTWLTDHHTDSSIISFRGTNTSVGDAVRIFDLELQALLTELEHYVPSSRFHLIGDTVKFTTRESPEFSKNPGPRSETAPARQKRRASGQTGREPLGAETKAPETPLAETPDSPASPAASPAVSPIIEAPPPSERDTPSPEAPDTQVIQTTTQPATTATGSAALDDKKTPEPRGPTKAERLANLRKHSTDPDAVRQKIADLAATLSEAEKVALLQAFDEAQTADNEGAIAQVLALADALERNALDPHRQPRVASSLATFLDSLGSRATATQLTAAYQLRQIALQIHRSVKREWPEAIAALPLNEAVFQARVAQFANRISVEFQQKNKFMELLPFIFGDAYMASADPNTLAILIFNLFGMTGPHNPFPADWNEFLSVFRRNFLLENPEMLALNSRVFTEASPSDLQTMAQKMMKILPGEIVRKSGQADGKSITIAIIPESGHDESALQSAADDTGIEALPDVEAGLKAKLAEGHFTAKDFVFEKAGDIDIVVEFTAVFDTPLHHPVLGEIRSHVFKTEFKLTQHRQGLVGDRDSIGSDAQKQKALTPLLAHPQGFDVEPLAVFGFPDASSAEFFSELTSLGVGLLIGSSDFQRVSSLIEAKRLADLRRAEQERQAKLQSAAAERRRQLEETETQRLTPLISAEQARLRALLDDEIASWGTLVHFDAAKTQTIRSKIDSLSASSIADEAIQADKSKTQAGTQQKAEAIRTRLVSSIQKRIAAIKPTGNSLALFAAKAQRNLNKKDWGTPISFDDMNDPVNVAQSQKELQAIEEVARQIIDSDLSDLLPNQILSALQSLNMAMALLAYSALSSSYKPDKALVQSFFELRSPYEYYFWDFLLVLVAELQPNHQDLKCALTALLLKSASDAKDEDSLLGFTQRSIGILDKKQPVNNERLIHISAPTERQDRSWTQNHIQNTQQNLIRITHQVESPSPAFKTALFWGEEAALLNAGWVMAQSFLSTWVANFSPQHLTKDEDMGLFIDPVKADRHFLIEEKISQRTYGPLWNERFFSHQRQLTPQIIQAAGRTLSDPSFSIPENDRLIPVAPSPPTPHHVIAVADNTNPENPIIHPADHSRLGQFVGYTGSFKNFEEMLSKLPEGWVILTQPLGENQGHNVRISIEGVYIGKTRLVKQPVSKPQSPAAASPTQPKAPKPATAPTQASPAAKAPAAPAKADLKPEWEDFGLEEVQDPNSDLMDRIMTTMNDRPILISSEKVGTIFASAYKHFIGALDLAKEVLETSGAAEKDRGVKASSKLTSISQSAEESFQTLNQNPNDSNIARLVFHIRDLIEWLETYKNLLKKSKKYAAGLDRMDTLTKAFLNEIYPKLRINAPAIPHTPGQTYHLSALVDENDNIYTLVFDDEGRIFYQDSSSDRLSVDIINKSLILARGTTRLGLGSNFRFAFLGPLTPGKRPVMPLQSRSSIILLRSAQISQAVDASPSHEILAASPQSVAPTMPVLGNLMWESLGLAPLDQYAEYQYLPKRIFDITRERPLSALSADSSHTVRAGLTSVFEMLTTPIETLRRVVNNSTDDEVIKNKALEALDLFNKQISEFKTILGKNLSPSNFNRVAELKDAIITWINHHKQTLEKYSNWSTDHKLISKKLDDFSAFLYLKIPIFVFEVPNGSGQRTKYALSAIRDRDAGQIYTPMSSDGELVFRNGLGADLSTEKIHDLIRNEAPLSYIFAFVPFPDPNDWMPLHHPDQIVLTTSYRANTGAGPTTHIQSPVDVIRPKGTRSSKAPLLAQRFQNLRTLSAPEIGPKDRAVLGEVARAGARALKMGSTYPVLSFDVPLAAFMFSPAQGEDGRAQLEIISNGARTPLMINRGEPQTAAGKTQTAELQAWAEGILADLDRLQQRVREGEKPGAVSLDLDEYLTEGLNATQDASFQLALPQVRSIAERLVGIGFEVQITGSVETLRVALSDEPGLKRFAAEPSAHLRNIQLLKPSTARSYNLKANEGMLVVSVFNPKSGEVVARDAAGELLAAAEMSLVLGQGDQVGLALAQNIAAKKGLENSLLGTVRMTLTNLALGQINASTLERAESLITLPYRLVGDLLDAEFLKAQLRRALTTSA